MQGKHHLRVEAVVFLGLTSGIGCLQPDNINTSISPPDVLNGDGSLASDQLNSVRPNAFQPGERGTVQRQGGLSAARRLELEARGSELLEDSLGARRDSVRPAPDGNEQGASAAPDPESSQGSAVAKSPTTSAENPESSQPDIQEAWKRFLDSVEENPRGGFSIGDMFFQDESRLLAAFEASYDGRIDKGLVNVDEAWPREGCQQLTCLDPPHVTVCWTPNSNATTNEKARVAALIKESWGRLSDTVFDFGSAGTFRTCQEFQDGFVLESTGGEDIRIYQNSIVTRGCSQIGKLSAITTSPTIPLTCGQSTLHDYASMWLPTGASLDDGGSPLPSLYLDYTAVHEFGHAIGLLHEQIRGEYNYQAGSGERWCKSADADLLKPNGQRMTEADVNGTRNGDFDDNSIMYYCQQDLNLIGGFTDPRAAELSTGDIFSSRRLYETQDYEVIFQYQSWYPEPVSLGLLLPGSTNQTWSVTAQTTAQTLSSGKLGHVGDDYTVSATALTNPRLKCTATKPGALGVFNGPAIIPPAGFSGRPVMATCYDFAGAQNVVSQLL
jgi:hypothetical protein